MVDFVSLFTGMSERDIGFLLKSIVQDSINSQLTNAEISDIDEKTPVLITNSKDVELMNDISIQAAINREPSTVYLMPEEPDGKDLKLWVKFHNAGELRDYSYQKNKTYSTGANTMPGLFSKFNDNSMMKYELYSYFNGNSHYAHTLDSPAIQILPNITNSKITSFFMRLVPVSLAKLLYTENIALFTKVDDDQLRYGYSVIVDSVGNLNFYIRNDYRQYHLPVKDAYNYILTDPLYDNGSNFRFENFNKKNFLTGFEFLCGLVAEELPFHDWFFKYNPITHNMSVINTTENNPAAVVADTSLITELPVLSCPIQEGKYTHLGTVQTTVYDNSGNNNNGTISNIITGGNWNDDNTLTSNGLSSGNIQIDFPSIPAINTLTEFTISFWFNPLDDLTTPAVREILHKGFATANSIRIFRDSGLNNIRFVIYNTGAGDFTSVIFPNAFPESNTWYFITCKWKTGEGLKISVNNSTPVISSNLSLTLTNSTDNLSIYRSTNGAKGITALFKFYNIQISQQTQDNLYYQGYHNPLFPKSENIQPEPYEPEEEVFVPFTNAYTLDKMSTISVGDYRYINSLSGDNPFIERYNVADGTSVSNPESSIYDVDDGVEDGGGGGGPTEFTRIGSAPATVDSSDNSSGKIGENENNAMALEIDTSGSGIGDTINGKVITKAIFWLRKEVNSGFTGTVYCRIWNSGSSLTSVATLGSVPADTLSESGDFVPVEFVNTDNTVAMADGYRIGLEYQGYGSGDVVDVQRRASDIDNSIIQASYDGNWSTNSSFEVKCDLYTGGTGTPSTDPFIYMEYVQKIGGGSTNNYRYDRIMEKFGSGDGALNQVPTKVKVKLKKVGSPTGTLRCYLRTSYNGTILAEFSDSINISSIPTTTTEYTFTNLSNINTISTNYVIMLFWEGMGSSTTNKLGVLTNTGTTDDHNGTSSHVQKYGYVPGFEGFANHLLNYTAIDVSGQVFKGGTSFDAFRRFSSTRSRITVKAVNSSSSIHNRKITKVIVRAKKFGIPAGIINCYLRDSNDNIKVTYSSVDVFTLGTAYGDVEFTNVVHNYLMNSATGSADKISIEYSGADTNNYVELNVNTDVLDTVNTIVQTYDSGNYTDSAQIDLAGKMYEGGEPDLNSRTRVVQSIEHQNSRLKGKKLTRIKVFLRRTTIDTSGTVFCNIRRGTDDSLVKTIDTVAVSSLNTTIGTPSEITFEDTTNNYPLTVGDKVSIEFNGGNTTDQVGVLVREVTPNYDGTDSYIRKYDEVDYDDVETTKDLCAVMDEGGFFFTPEAGQTPDPTPTNIKDLLYGAGNNAKSGFMEMFLMEFRIYSKDITLNQADNLYNNRYSISPIGNGEILCPFSFRPVTLDPV